MAADSCRLGIKAIPNASRDEIGGWLGDLLKIKVRAPALEGRANDALCEFLAESLNLPARAITVLRGQTSRQKVLNIEGISLEELRRRVAAKLS